MTEWFLSGLVAWVITGIDDMLVVFLLGHKLGYRSKILLTIGTVVGTMLMLVFCFVINTGLVILLQSSSTKLLALLPLYLGFKALKGDDEDQQKLRQGRWFWIMVSAFVIYMGNSLDDHFVNLSLMQQTDQFSEVAAIGLGNIVGCLLACTFVNWFQQQLSGEVVRKVLRKIAGVVLIIIAAAIAFR